nr:uncharacterized protein CTRU02_02185 [Colletotrichum truncatum]KAF6799314.1 hypothetical protein CTRU02_02185 [Colletotrichum truncatum]
MSFQNTTLVINLKGGQFGEAYHVLLLRILLGFNSDSSVKLHVNFDFNAANAEGTEEDKERNKKSLQEIKSLFNWYDRPRENSTRKDKPEVKAAGDDAKSLGTRIIAAAFRASNDKGCYKRHNYTFDTQAGTYIPDQGGISYLIRRSLDLVEREYSARSFDNHEIAPSNIRYFQPSYAAKYWLNRYFRLTKQFKDKHEYEEKKSRKKKKDDRDPKDEKAVHLKNTRDDKNAVDPDDSDWPHDSMGMPKLATIDNLAVVHVRNSVPRNSEVGRLMDRKNLDLCPTEEKLPPRRFSHVMLYGDFAYLEGEEYQKKAAEILDGVHVSFICRPWESSSKTAQSKTPNSYEPDEKSLAQQVDDLWANFRNFNIDRLPVQVKILGIWKVLKDRYSSQVCVIGHRSGFIEAAAIIGIPVFYLNNERIDIDKDNKLRNGEFLWKAAVGEPKRLRELSDQMNTLIPVEALKNKAEKDADTDREVFRKDEKFKTELRAALFMFMSCQVPWEYWGNMHPRPAWLARVKLIHDEDGPGKAGPGQRWLQKKWELATQPLETFDPKAYSWETVPGSIDLW